MFMSDIPAKYQHIPFNNITRIAREYNVCPYLITAIGWHETQWGKLGLGRVGFYTGYGAFDHGPDARFADRETQIRGTARMMREWGMHPGRVTLERLQRGNKGEFGRIYATDKYWPDKVWRHYQRIKQEIDLDEKMPNDFEVTKGQSEWLRGRILEQWREQKHDFRPGFEEWKRERGYLQRNIELGPTQQIVRILVIIILVIFMMSVIGWAFKDEALKIIKTVRGG